MNLRDLRYLITVAETLHFGKAAKACFISQPTLSAQIRKLEDELGVTIFERTNRSVSLTPIGEKIIEHARMAVSESDAIRDIARAFHDPLAGPIKIGAIPTLSPYLMPMMLQPLKEQYPNLRLVLAEEKTETLLERVRAHTIDAALIATDVPEGDLEEILLFDEPFWLAHPQNHPLYLKDEITREDLMSEHILLLADGHCLADQVMGVCGMDRAPPEGMDDLRAASLETLMQLVASGVGCTLLPALAIRGSWMTGGGVIARKLELPNAYRRVRMVFRPTFPRRRALEAMAALILEKLPNTVHAINTDDTSSEKLK
jgi:LysR family hydrogen peroxide-inducible transcriptional activator